MQSVIEKKSSCPFLFRMLCLNDPTHEAESIHAYILLKAKQISLKVEETFIVNFI